MPLESVCWQLGNPTCCAALPAAATVIVPPVHCPCPAASPLQVTVLGMKMGAWGKEKYGLKPKKVEALEFYR
jgi:hypothetical protein